MIDHAFVFILLGLGNKKNLILIHIRNVVPEAFWYNFCQTEVILKKLMFLLKCF